MLYSSKLTPVPVFDTFHVAVHDTVNFGVALALTIRSTAKMTTPHVSIYLTLKPHFDTCYVHSVFGFLKHKCGKGDCFSI